jgi:hypothetical protein
MTPPGAPTMFVLGTTPMCVSMQGANMDSMIGPILQRVRADES